MSAHLTALRSICIHEAAHAAVARHYGHATHWEVMLEAETGPHSDQVKYWSGWTAFYGGRLGVTPERRIGLAGVVAELLDDNIDVCPYAVDDFLQNEDIEMSNSDWDLVGDYRIRDVRDTIRLVKRMLPGILWEAERVASRHMGDAHV